ncbi:MAG: DUF748 domain-containing protein [Woeseiaceae bacterium]
MNIVSGLAVRHRKLLFWLAGLLVVYTLAGFLLAPWLVKRNAIKAVHDMYGADLSIDKLAINPYVLSLRIDGLSMHDPDGAPFVAAKSIYVNFQLSSLFRWAWTFAEFRLDDPVLHVARDEQGALSLAFLTKASSDTVPEDAGSAALPRLIVQDFSINNGAAHWHDAVPAAPVETTFGPVNVQVLDLNTLPKREGEQDVVVTTESAGTFSWHGSLQLNPLQSKGHASIEGSQFGLVSAYVRDDLGFEIARGKVDIDLDYFIDTRSDGALEAGVDNLAFTFADVLLRTFGRTAADGGNADRDVLTLPRLRLDGGTLRWPEKTASIGSLAVDDAVLGVYRDAAGQLNVVPKPSPVTEPSAEPATGVADGPDWSVSLDRIEINGMAAGLVDDSVSPQADIGVEDLALVMTGIDNAPGTRIPVTVAMRSRSGGHVAAEGELRLLPDPVADLRLTADGLSLALLHPYIAPLADVSLDKGSLGFTADVHSGPGEPLAFKGDVSIRDFLITETEQGSRLGSWDALTAKQLALDLGAGTLEISELGLDNAFADVFIDKDGKPNLGRIPHGKQSATAAEEAGESAETTAPEDDNAMPLTVTIGRVVIDKAAANYADFSLPLPFDEKIADLSGTLTTISSSSSQPSEVSLEGKVGEYGLVKVTGTVTPLQPALDTDLKVRFENVEMPKFSAYTVPFAGREIASGKLDLDLGYTVRASELVGENNVVLRDFELGDKVEHPGAMSLPLGLAVALLKDPDGTIDIDLPVRGNVDDPKFRYGRVIGKALVNLIVKIATSPFALLGKLVGAEGEDLEYINFQDGRADLTPPEQEKIDKLAEALGMRPQLNMQVNGVVDRARDGLALRTAKVDARIDEQIAAKQGGKDSEGMYAKLRTEVLESMFREADQATAESGAEDAGDTLEALRAQFTSEQAAGEGGKPVKAFDELAYTAELRRRLIDREPVADEELAALATGRAQSVKAALLAIDATLADRISLGRPQALQAKADEPVRIKIALQAGSDDGETGEAGD